MQLDLLARSEPERDVGKGNALFLGDLANGATASELRTNWRAGKYPGLSPRLAQENIAFWRLK